jgi:hypothetical protein
MAIVYAACLVGTAAEPRNDIVVGKFIVEPPRVTNH